MRVATERTIRETQPVHSVWRAIQGGLRPRDRYTPVVLFSICTSVFVECHLRGISIEPDSPETGITGQHDQIATVRDEMLNLIAHLG